MQLSILGIVNSSLLAVFLLTGTASAEDFSQAERASSADSRQASKSYPILSGVGLALASQDGHVVVGKVIPNTPAAESGRISEGARIISIEVEGRELDVRDKEVGEIVSLIRGVVGTDVVLGLLSPGKSEPTKVRLTRAPLEVPGVPASSYQSFIGKPLPALTFRSLAEGNSETLAEYRGKIVVLDFWASWCPACYAPVSKLQTMVTANPHWQGRVELIAVTIDAEVDKALAVIKERGWKNTRHRAADHDQLQKSGIRVIPVVIIVAADGTVATMAGAHALDVAAEVERLLAAG